MGTFKRSLPSKTFLHALNNLVWMRTAIGAASPRPHRPLRVREELPHCLGVRWIQLIDKDAVILLLRNDGLVRSCSIPRRFRPN